jgi:protein-S-isoprenylcysteine O-methyltransferase Ste14
MAFVSVWRDRPDPVRIASSRFTPAAENGGQLPNLERIMLARTGILLYGAAAYVLALANIAYLIGFIADYGVPKGINDGPAGPLWLALVVDAALIALFGLHHSLTARSRFKIWWTRIVPPSMERATYLYMTAVTTGLLVVFWRPIPVTLWEVEGLVAGTAIVTAYLGVFAMMFAATFHFGHFAFFGLRQAYDRFRGAVGRSTGFAARWLYAVVRHPIGLGWMLAPWLTPHMTAGQLVFALGTVAYVFAATPHEEAELVAELGDDYRRYRQRVPAFVPGRIPAAGRSGADDSPGQPQEANA